MALPAEFGTVTLAGKYVDLKGAPVLGTVTFTAPTILTAATSDAMVVPKPFVVTLDVNGEFTIVLPATNDPDISPVFTYRVVEAFTSSGVSPGRSFDINLPYDSVGTVQLADIAPVSPVVSGTAYLTQASADVLYLSSAHSPPVPPGRWRSGLRDLSLVSGFQSGHGWTLTSGTGGSVADDTAFQSPFGSQSVKMLAGSTAGRIDKSGLSLNLTGQKRLVVGVYFDVPVAGLAVYAASGGGFSNYYLWILNLPSARTAGWQLFEFCPGVGGSATGTPDYSAITNIRIATTGSSGQCHIGAVATRTTTLFPNGVWTPSVDDGGASSYTYRGTFAKYGVRPELCIITEAIASDGSHLSLDNLKELSLDYGWDICGHADTYAHHDATAVGFAQGYPSLSDAAMEVAFRAERQFLTDNGFNSSTWAAPHSSINDAVVRIGSKYFSTLRSTGSVGLTVTGQQQPPALRPWAALANAWSSSASAVATAKAAMDAAKASGGWFYQNLHGISASDPGDGSQSISVADLDALCAYAQSIGMAILPADEVRRRTLEVTAI